MPTTIDQTEHHVANCGTCIFWAAKQQGSANDLPQGECRRFPPQVAGLITQTAIQGKQTVAVTASPMTNAEYGCGEYRPMPKQEVQQ